MKKFTFFMALVLIASTLNAQKTGKFFPRMQGNEQKSLQLEKAGQAKVMMPNFNQPDPRNQVSALQSKPANTRGMNSKMIYATESYVQNAGIYVTILGNPGNGTLITPLNNGFDIQCMEWVDDGSADGVIYAITRELDYDTWKYFNEFGTINPNTGQFTAINDSINCNAVGLAWHPVRHEMYASTWDKKFGRIDITTGEFTQIGSDLTGIVTIAIDNSGTCYAQGTKDMSPDIITSDFITYFGTIDIKTGNFSIIWYYQLPEILINIFNMEIDRGTDELYCAPFLHQMAVEPDYRPYFPLWSMNKITGHYTDVGLCGDKRYESFCIIGNTQQANDVAVTTVKVPSAYSIMASTTHFAAPILTSSEQVVATIRNYGSNPITSVQLKLTVDGVESTETLSSVNITPWTTYIYTFNAKADLSAIGDHIVSVSATFAEDTNPDNDTKEITVTHANCEVTNFPWYDDSSIESEYSLCWQKLGHDNAEGFGWTWSRRYGYDGDWYFTSCSQFRLGLYNEIAGTPLNPDNWLITPHLVLNDNYTLSYKLRGNNTIGGFSINKDKVAVLVSTTGTDFSDFTEIACNTVRSQEPEIITVPLNQYKGQSIYIAFRHWDCVGFWIEIDDFSITKSTDNDAAITAITAPQSGHNLSAAETVTATIKNFGVNPITAMQLELIVDDIIIATENYTGVAIASWTTKDFTFSTKADLSTNGYHTVAVKAILEGDQKTDNDELSVSIRNVNCNKVNTFPWFEGFEDASALDCWLQEYTPGTVESWAAPNGQLDWQFINSTSFYYDNYPAFMGEYAIVYANGVGDANYQTKLVTPALDLSTLDRPALKFLYAMQSHEIFGFNDSLAIFYKTSEAGKWVHLVTYNKGFNGWEEPIIPLPEPSSEYYIAFEGTNLKGNPILIDNVNVYNIADTDAGVFDISIASPYMQNTKPTSLLWGDPQEKVTAIFRNYGSTIITPDAPVQLKLTVDGNVLATETYPGSIGANGGSGTYTFTTTADLSMPGNHTIEVATVMAGDGNTVNDSQSINIYTVCGPTDLPIYRDFEDDYNNPTAMCWRFISNNEENTAGGIAGQTWILFDENGNYLTAVFVFDSHILAENGDYNQYFISPLIASSPNGVAINFDATSSAGANELFRLGYSTTTSDINAFTWNSGPLVCNSTNTFTHYNYFAPAGTKYIAFNYYSNHLHQLGIDNVNISDAQSGVDVVNGNNGVKVYSSNGEIIVNAPVESAVRIFDLYGRVLGNYNAGAGSTLKIPENNGIYLVEVKNKSGIYTQKVLVK